MLSYEMKGPNLILKFIWTTANWKDINSRKTNSSNAYEPEDKTGLKLVMYEELHTSIQTPLICNSSDFFIHLLFHQHKLPFKKPTNKPVKLMEYSCNPFSITTLEDSRICHLQDIRECRRTGYHLDNSFHALFKHCTKKIPSLPLGKLGKF
jgi:hypothetical protein